MTTNAVIHIHNAQLWKDLIDKAPTTVKTVNYGTPEMAYEIKRLLKESVITMDKVFVMGGHEEGLISFGKDLNEAGDILLSAYEKIIG